MAMTIKCIHQVTFPGNSPISISKDLKSDSYKTINLFLSEGKDNETQAPLVLKDDILSTLHHLDYQHH